MALTFAFPPSPSPYTMDVNLALHHLDSDVGKLEVRYTFTCTVFRPADGRLRRELMP